MLEGAQYTSRNQEKLKFNKKLKLFLGKAKMSNVPMLFRDWWSDYDIDFEPLMSRPRTSRLIDQHFGKALRRNDLLSSFANTQISSPAPRSPYYRPWGSALSRQDSGSTLNVEKNKFEIILDVQQFTPNEISVKTADKFIIIEGMINGHI